MIAFRTSIRNVEPGLIRTTLPGTELRTQSRSFARAGHEVNKIQSNRTLLKIDANKSFRLANAKTGTDVTK